METLHVRNLEKYQPSYKDGRRLLWIRWDVDTISDYEFSMLTPSQRYLLIALSCLETKLQKELPNDLEWLSHETKYPKSLIHKDLLMLQKNGFLVTSCNGENNLPLPTDRHTDIQTDKHSMSISNEILDKWNNFCEKYQKLAKIKSVSETRKKKLRARLDEESFKNFDEILKAIEEQPFLIHGDSNSKFRDWRVSFDWLIENDTNYLKVLERKYKNADSTPEVLKKYLK